MKIRIAAAALTLALVSGSAVAQPRWYGVDSYGALPSYAVASIVRSAGLRPISRPMRVGRDYVVEAVDNYGATRRVVIDAQFGDILRIVSTGRAAEPRRDYAYRRATRDDGYDDDAFFGPAARRGWRDPFDWGSGARMRDDYDVPRRFKRPPERIPESSSRRTRPSAPTARGEAPAHTASINPTERVQPPLPRARPVLPPVESKTPAEPSPPAQASVPPPSTPAPAVTPAPRAAPRTASPRVILPGGPATKSEAASEASINSGATDKAPVPAAKALEPFPPVQAPDR